MGYIDLEALLVTVLRTEANTRVHDHQQGIIRAGSAYP